MNDRLWTRFVAEAIGVFMLCFVGILAILNLGGQEGGLTGIALAHGLAIMVMVAALGHVSGGHFNPAITLGLLLGRQIDPLPAVGYWISQLLGGLVAALVIGSAYSTDVVANGTPALARPVSLWEGILLEAVATFFLVLVVFGTAVDKRAPASVYPIGIGLTITAGILAIGPWTGAALNPARWFGPAVVSGQYDNALVWIVGPLLGGVVAWLVHDFVMKPREAAEPIAAAARQEP